MENGEGESPALPENLGWWLRSFETYLARERRSSWNTVMAYVRDVADLLEFAGGEDVADARQLDVLVIRRYLALLHRRKLDPASIGRRISAFRSFFGIVARMYPTYDDPMEAIRSPKKARKLPRVLSVDDVFAVLDGGDEDDDPLAARDHAILEVLYGAGLRVSEVVDLDDRSVERADGAVTLRVHGSMTRTASCLWAARRRARWMPGWRSVRRSSTRRAARATARSARCSCAGAARGSACARCSGWSSGVHVACCRGMRARMRCATPAPRTCSTAAPTCGRSRSCSATPAWARRSATPRSRSII